MPPPPPPPPAAATPVTNRRLQGRHRRLELGSDEPQRLVLNVQLAVDVQRLGGGGGGERSGHMEVSTVHV